MAEKEAERSNGGKPAVTQWYYEQRAKIAELETKIARLERDYRDPTPRMRCGGNGEICECEVVIGRGRVGNSCIFPMRKLTVTT